MHKLPINNPWVGLSKKPPLILKQDKDRIRSFNDGLIMKKSRWPFIIRSTLLPEPFIGNPYTASVVLLNLNASVGPTDPIWHRKRSFKLAVRNNLRHRKTPYPFYPLDPRFKKSGAGKWWRRHLKEVLKDIDDEKLIARKICVIEWFPYHSLRAKLKAFRKQPLPSQEYSFSLAQNALSHKNGKIIIVMRARKEWTKSIGSLKRALMLNSPQAVYLSRKNLGLKNFERLLKAIKG